MRRRAAVRLLADEIDFGSLRDGGIDAANVRFGTFMSES
jgi:hypothetical protein